MSEVITPDINSPPVQYLCKKDKRLAKVIDLVGPITYTPHEDELYAFLIHEIIEQMLSAKAGNKIFERFTELCGGIISPEIVSSLTDEQIKSTGTSINKVRCIRSLTDAIIDESISLNAFRDYQDGDVIKDLTSIKGIGQWTAKMFLIFVLNRYDILPYEDVAFLQSYQWLYKTSIVDKASVEKRCKKWKPYSSIAARYMYRALDTGLTKEEFHLYKGEQKCQTLI